MSFIDVLRESATAPQVEFNIFLSSFNPTAAALWAFVEGRDDLTFYRPHLRSLIPESIALDFVKVGTKHKVLEMCCDFVKRFGANPRGMFFVDRDLDALIERPCDCPRLFVTRWYSIENELCVEDVIISYCVECLGMESRAPIIEAFVSQFQRAWDAFLLISQFFTAWLVAVRRQRLKANVNNIDFGKLFSFDEIKVLPELRMSLQDSLDYLRNSSGGNMPFPEIPTSVMDNAIQDVVNENAHALIRGKQAIWFLVRYLDLVESLARSAGHKFTRRVNLTSSNAVEVFAPRIAAPPDLRAYIDATLTSLSGASSESGSSVERAIDHAEP